MMNKVYCCEGFRLHIKESNVYANDEGEKPSFFIIVVGNNDSIPIYFCPWCGTKL